MYLFKLRTGTHREAGVTHRSGAEFKSTTDLRIFNTPRVEPRFILLSETDETPEVDKAPETPEKPLADMHVKQLDKLAREKEIETEHLSTKEDYLAALAAHGE